VRLVNRAVAPEENCCSEEIDVVASSLGTCSDGGSTKEVVGAES
jgi:hypothetical protein